MKKKVVVVGGGIAGVFAALAAAREGAETTLIESSKKVGVSKALLPLLLSGGLVEGDLVLPEAGLLTSEGVEVRAEERVVSAEREGRRILVSSDRGRGRGERFDSLVICTGATAQVPRLRGLSKQNVFLLKDASDYLRLSSALDGLGIIVLSGPVPLALKLGELLNARGKEVRIYLGEGGLSRQFSEPVAQMIRRGASARSGAQRVSLVEGGVDSILGVGKAEAIVSGGSVQTCDGVVIMPRRIPVVPVSGCERAPDGGVLVDASMRTSVEGVFAAGDSAELRFKSGSVPARLYSTSRTGGEVAGINAAGGNARASLSWAVEQEFFGVEFCSAGLREEEALALGLDGASETGSSACPDYRSGEKEERKISVSIVYDRSTHQVYGLQLAGWRASSFSNVASLIVSLGLTVDQIAHLESPYSPGLGYGSSPIGLTAGKIRGKERS